MPGCTKMQIEEAIISALAPLRKENGGYLRVLEAYKGELSQSGLLPAGIQTPAVFIAWAGSSFGPGPYLETAETMSFNVVAVCGPSPEPDVFGVLDDVRGIICGSSITHDARPLKLVREFPLTADKSHAIVASLYTFTQGVPLPAQA